MSQWLIGTIALAYLFGSIPFGLLLTRLAGVKDIRKIGSGNIGATNVMRSGHKHLAIMTLVLDAAKGALAVFLIRFAYNEDMVPIAGLFAVIGHVFPVWLKFKGGKGVATTIGVFIALNPYLGLSVCGLWLVIFMLSRISSLSAIMSIGYSAIAAYLLDSYITALLCLALACLILYTHRSNIFRMLQGSEGTFHTYPI